MSIGVLISGQNSDGGWPYVRGHSWTEPTVYAVMALLGAGEEAPVRRGLRWLAAVQRPDGGWPPQQGVDLSTWVTALAALLPPELLGERAHARAIEWLMGTKGEESTINYRLREWLLGNSRPPEAQFPGWPWVRGTAAWVGPTSLAILALDRENRRKPRPDLQQRIEAGRIYLLTHMCRQGGWNHGANQALGRDILPYPETTGMGLAAMRGVPPEKIEHSVRVARGFLQRCRSADALNWLRLGLLAHGAFESGYCPPWSLECRTLHEKSMDLVVAQVEKGSNAFWT
jgi:hypothetical protein